MNSFLKHFIILFTLISIDVFGQTPINDNCEDAMALCYNEWTESSNVNATLDSCLGCSDWANDNFCFILNNPVWFSFNTNSKGGAALLFVEDILCENPSNDSYSNELRVAILKADVNCDASTYQLVAECEYGNQNNFNLSTIHLAALETYFVVVDGGTNKNNLSELNPAECGFRIKISGAAVYPEVSAGEDIYQEYGSSFQLAGTGNGQPTWFPNLNLSNNNILNPVYSGINNAEFELIILENNGCEYVDYLSIFVEKVLKIPNAITANGDGINDGWIIENIEGYPTCNVTIFDRWGQQVFNAVGYDNSNPWVGKRNHSFLPAGTYFYVINTNSISNQKIYRGSINVIK